LLAAFTNAGSGAVNSSLTLKKFWRAGMPARQNIFKSVFIRTLNLLIINQFCDCRVLSAYSTVVCVAWKLNLVELLLNRVIRKKIACQKLSDT
jgi:hypothetical protein